ncbi:4-hydroxy-tetrahydrodipicolinate synthase [Saccharopolyspora karakumensis]|uniref:4-hydroxy-tetrahydrodipicolinate synthase n=1 Tax=Saccharopolyspora karakumensis TaxID=2530386 RepID=A0A4R5BRY7_9PSEU|nr:4-hydroxy-tetrahydrodipicolinate synthase [Saccharopolyspora karakumensis]TDD88769.1 4-hydroxy-tetrahydrodipicolinate synthase [Saccharopolyspora karakumensis]
MSLGSVITAIVTPFDDRQKVDEEAFLNLFRHLLANGSDGVVVCGTTGEAPTLSDAEHLRLVELAVGERPEGVTVIASTGSNNTAHACWMTERVTEIGADGILSVTPYYNKPNRRGLVRHFTEIGKATDKPVVLYNVPSRIGLSLDNDLLAELGQIDNLDYVKQADNDALAQVDGLGLYAGNDDGFAQALDLGAVGGILVASHLVGPRMKQMVTDPTRRAEIDASLKPLYSALGVTTNPIPVKAALNLLGHEVGAPRLPLVEADESELQVIRNALTEVGLS